MCVKSRLKGLLHKKHGKRAQRPLKSVQRYLYHICSSLETKFSWKKSMLVLCKILRLYVKTLTAQITVSENGDFVIVCKIPSKRSLPKKTLQKDRKTVEISTTLPLPYLFIPVIIIQLEKVYVSAMQILKIVC